MYLPIFPRTAPCYHTEGSPCPHQIPQFYKNFIASIGLHPGSMVNSVTCSMGRTINDACQIFETVIWCGSLII